MTIIFKKSINAWLWARYISGERCQFMESRLFLHAKQSPFQNTLLLSLQGMDFGHIGKSDDIFAHYRSCDG
jgi:hypothetical protein